METIVLASNNQHKIKEFKEIMKDYNIVTMAEVGFTDDIVEDGDTFLANSTIKSKTIAKYLKEKNLNYMVMADDSGLCVDALNGNPGVYSARYAGEHTQQANRDKLLANLKDVEDPNRTARFKCVITLLKPDGTMLVGEGKVEGKILKQETGDTSFGYDCLFYSNELKKCFGQATETEKNSVSHRGRAIADLLKKL
ncbi:MAG: RdgB/HAM1 family non-canonical purine NTP pyrophosphatase [Firmicutes bacterium]|nr:RdgB/HAM1 family non-canonical purine NTP pyrophosphatase [Bacillota bacterium]